MEYNEYHSWKEQILFTMIQETVRVTKLFCKRIFYDVKMGIVCARLSHHEGRYTRYSCELTTYVFYTLIGIIDVVTRNSERGKSASPTVFFYICEMLYFMSVLFVLLGLELISYLHV